MPLPQIILDNLDGASKVYTDYMVGNSTGSVGATGPTGANGSSGATGPVGPAGSILPTIGDYKYVIDLETFTTANNTANDLPNFSLTASLTATYSLIYTSEVETVSATVVNSSMLLKNGAIIFTASTSGVGIGLGDQQHAISMSATASPGDVFKIQAQSGTLGSSWQNRHFAINTTQNTIGPTGPQGSTGAVGATGPMGGFGLTYSGLTNSIAYFNSLTGVTSSGNLTFDGTTMSVTGINIMDAIGSITHTFSSINTISNATITSLAGTGNRVLSTDANGVVGVTTSIFQTSQISPGTTTLSGTQTYVVGTKLPYLGTNTTYKWRMYITKTNAGIAAPIVRILYGLTGSVADVTVTSLTFSAQTAAVDTGVMDIDLNFISGVPGSSYIGTYFIHNLATTGLSTLSTPQILTAFNSTFTVAAGNFFGISIDPGASAVWSIRAVTAQAQAK